MMPESPIPAIPPAVPLILGLAVLTAIGYAAATVGMKVTAGGAGWVGIAVILAGLTAATAAEILMLQRIDLARTYIFITAAETIVIFAAAIWLGERLALAQITGAALVLAGLTLTLA